MAKKSAKKPKISRKSFLTTLWLATIFGIFGVDRFYLQHKRSGILKLISLGGVGIWTVIDIIYTLSGKRRDAAGEALTDYDDSIVSVAWSVPIIMLLYGNPYVYSRVVTFLHNEANKPGLRGNTSEFSFVLLLAIGPIIGSLLFFSGFNIVDAIRKKLIVWASVNIIVAIFGFGFVTLYYYFFVRTQQSKTTLI